MTKKYTGLFRFHQPRGGQADTVVAIYAVFGQAGMEILTDMGVLFVLIVFSHRNIKGLCRVLTSVIRM